MVCTLQSGASVDVPAGAGAGGELCAGQNSTQADHSGPGAFKHASNIPLRISPGSVAIATGGRGVQTARSQESPCSPGCSTDPSVVSNRGRAQGAWVMSWTAPFLDLDDLWEQLLDAEKIYQEAVDAVRREGPVVRVCG